MISEHLTVRLLSRFRRHAGFPALAEDRDLLMGLVAALQGASASEQHAHSIIARLAQTLHFAPVEADIWEAAKATAPEPEPTDYPEWKSSEAPPIECEGCQDWGCYQDPSGRTVRCSCRFGVEVSDGYLELANRTAKGNGAPARPRLVASKAPPLKPITQADIDAVLRSLPREGA